MNDELTESTLSKCCLDPLGLGRLQLCLLRQQVAGLNERQVELVFQTFRVLFALAAGWTENEDSFHYFQNTISRLISFDKVW